jgi:anti-sigma28 factor (negative regulator of flagellin synthesis)
MKVPGSDGSSNSLPRIKEGVGDSRSVARKGSGEADTRHSGLLGELSKRDTDTITVSPLSSRIRAELNPANMADERRSRVEELGRQVANGSYNPPRELVANAIGEEISFEVLLGKVMNK